MAKAEHYGKHKEEQGVEENIHAREVVQEILNFGASQQQIQQIIYLLALELENRELMLKISGAVQGEKTKTAQHHEKQKIIILEEKKIMSDVIDKWNEIKILVESLELDVHKNASGNSSAGVRARRGLRLLKSNAAELVKLTISEEKTGKD